jgi:hypothetical protein
MTQIPKAEDDSDEQYIELLKSSNTNYINTTELELIETGIVRQVYHRNSVKYLQ